MSSFSDAEVELFLDDLRDLHHIKLDDDGFDYRAYYLNSRDSVYYVERMCVRSH